MALLPQGSLALLPDGGVALLLARATYVAALLSLSGCLVFRTLVAPRAADAGRGAGAAAVERALSRLTWISLVVSLPGLAVWAVLQTGAISDADGPSQALSLLPVVLADTRFGRLVLLQLALAAATGVLLAAGRLRLAAIVAAADAAAQAGHGHAMAMRGGFSLLFGLDVLHLLAASVWIGGLVPLLLVVRLGPAAAGAAAARWFAPLGKWSVGLLAGSALVQGWVLVGSLTALRTMPYGVVVLVKTALFGVLLGLALLNRYRLAPRLRGGDAETARRRLVGSIVVQTGFGLLAVAASAVLSGLTPGMDMQAAPS